ncbi:polyribonucleotide nucleotidyltransferase [Candidatus Roizmanbacteria bacterium CG22_combo_CG10-13_8_21_14_all_35_9]|uniref:Polyribonucleotide nucleotidyltransferase n=4 Tax=Candidatus Roizmaniibacteriota TaxID=1752723 RepID=A0A2M8F1E3_9BACT|nr:MAG: polyribonucleotide nucleotidyltransferase [Candidatus Roizmanbacteria bacterium CG23_combo_of_CG06-09_8_20_14_all_35_49]PIP62921.1 MAG: polyribonucleotide nucleotidyltransferase [Candidatus Roizmanbacteria bacterium CG22_combo_CG10-13_8_21_14_all_35_9]PIY71426.1 MAG: polyribonucleotide nucleotidyltransferase [Candidatus Roizmanbacteria bacterium CG_4_10_14_0_8_um_filter_35_28]PJC33122.1 MAG: polyribonucleotide nucleotidyltransferase [Candidatus Roizmanbacteria bacterium CG_4_9_14_0_2_um_
MNITEESFEIDGQKLTLQFGKLAQAVDTSVYATLGDTAVLVTVAVGPENPNIDYFPLSVEYAEKLYAGGLIKGSRWIKREGRPSDYAVLTGRLIDRSIRPLFPKTYKKQVQVVVTLLSVDGVNDPAVLSAIAASAALTVSSVPWAGPISTVRIGYITSSENKETELILNPTENEEEFSSLDLVVSSTKDKILMIETKANMIKDEIIQEAIEMAKKENQKIIEFIAKVSKKIGKKKDIVPDEESYPEILKLIKGKYAKPVAEVVKQTAETAGSEDKMIHEIVSSIYDDLEKKYDTKQILATINKNNYETIKKNILEKKTRPDDRKVNEVRKLNIEVSVLPRTHGSALFQRGQTQILSITTLGSTTLEQLIEGPEGKEAKRYIHHYSDGPYSYGQVGRMMGPSRRAIGHGALAEKAIEPVLPSVEEFPYAIRVVSEILSENGSSSMGSVSGSSLSLMDAGVPLKKAVTGVAMGLVSKSDDDYVVLTDIVGLEDFAGEMDFKIAGTSEGVTAIQLDVKNKGLTQKMIKDIFAQAKKARLEILDSMNKVIDRPRKEISRYAPKVVVLTPPQDKIGDIIGPGGKNIRALIAKTQTEINVDDDGKVTVSGLDRAKVDEAVAHINNITRVIQVGEEFEGEVKRILQFGAFVEMLPGKEGLVHVSKMGRGFVKNPYDVVKIGQKVRVRVYQIDNMGRINLQMIQ